MQGDDHGDALHRSHAAGSTPPTGPVLQLDETRQGRIHRALRDIILSGAIAPGARLRETELSAQFGSSRAPLREAIRRLESEGLVRSDFWRGSRVAEYSADELFDLYALRGMIEGHAATTLSEPPAAAAQARMAGHLDAMAAAARAGQWLAVAQHDTAWHREIMLAAGRPVLLEAWDGANGPLQMNFGRFAGDFYACEDIHHRHHAVLRALATREAGTEQTIRRHYLDTAERLLAAVAARDPARSAPPDPAGATPPARATSKLPPAAAHTSTGGTT